MFDISQGMSHKPASKELSVELAGVKLSLTVSPSEEIAVLAAVEELNGSYEDMRRQFANKVSRTDLLSMLLLTRATRLQELQDTRQNTSLDARLERLNGLLDKTLTR